MISLFPQQQESVRILCSAISRHNAALCASAVGTGKTYVALGVCRQLQQAPLVICPKAVLVSWTRAAEAMNLVPAGVINYEKIKTGKTQFLEKIGKTFRWKLPPGSLVIFDEVHVCKALASQNAAILAAAKAQGLRVLMLSATPFQDPSQLKAIGYVLGLHRYHDFYKWALSQGCRMNNWKQLEFPKSEMPKLEALAKSIYPDKGHFLTREDLGEHFAEVSIDWSPLEFSDKHISAAYGEVSEQLENLAARMEQDGEEPIQLVELLRARQKVELLKIPVTLDLIDEYLEQGFSVFVALNFNDSINAVLSKYPDAAVVRGGQSQCERQAAIDSFQNNKVRICVANLAAGGVGISLHDTSGTHPRAALISPSFSAIALKQTLGRIDRVGAKSNVIQRILIAGGTIEERICALLRQKIAKLELTMTEGTAMTSPQATLKPETLNTVTKTADPDNGHAKFSPSQLKYFAKCPGYGPNNSENEASIAGTRIHDALERDDDSKLQSEEEVWMAGQCRLAILGILGRHKFTSFDDVREVRLTIAAGEFSTYGTCDRLFLSGSHAVAADYKTGRGAIDDAEVNWQAFAYTAGVFQKYPEVDTVDFYFIVPKREEVSHAKFTRSDLPRLLRKINSVLQAATEAHAYWRRGEFPPPDMLKQDGPICRYCRFAETCPKNRTLALTIASKYAPDITLPDAVHGSENDSPDEIAAMLKIIPIVEAWASGIKKKARVMAIEQGLLLPGYELTLRQGKRSITDPLAAFEAVKARGVTYDKFIGAIKTFPVGEYEDLISSVAPRGKKSALISEVMADLFASGGLKQSEDSYTLSEIK